MLWIPDPYSAVSPNSRAMWAIGASHLNFVRRGIRYPSRTTPFWWTPSWLMESEIRRAGDLRDSHPRRGDC